MQKTKDLVKNKKVLFITTKNIDYIRNTQEIRLIKAFSDSVEILYSDKKNNPLRIIHVLGKIKKRMIDKYDVVFVGFEPQFIVPFVGKKFKNKVLITDFFISVYDTLICDRKKFKKGGIVAGLSRWMDKKTLQAANHVITDTNAHADYFINEFDGDADKFETIYLEADSSVYYPRPQNKPAEYKDKFVVLYFGSILPLQGVDIVLEAIRELKDRNDIFFDIIGPVPDKYNKPLQDNVVYTEWLSQEELADHIANADLCLAGHFSASIDKAWRTIPGKAYIYEMMEKPMILGDGKANHELFVEDGKHIFTERGSAKHLAKCIVDYITQ
jgi:glycosyltransferase involved in cell wall biosynthesis